MALGGVGVKQADARKAIKVVLEKDPGMAAEDLIREGLRELS